MAKNDFGNEARAQQHDQQTRTGSLDAQTLK